MDSILSEFVAKTSADPGLATDLLEAHKWNLNSAISAYYVMKGLLPGEVPCRVVEIASMYSSKNSSTVVSNDSETESSSTSINSSRPPLKKVPAFDFDDAERKLARGISRATDNFTLVSQARKELAEDFDTAVDHTTRPAPKLELPEHSFSLPDFSVFPHNLREYLHKDLIENATLVSLEQAGRLNWWYARKIGPKLWPLSTTGDGNCLLHAASLGMWGFHDRLLTLRKALHSLLVSSSFTDAFYRRWRWQTSLQNKEAGLIYCEEEWEREWQSLLKLSSSEPRQSSTQRSSSEHLSSSNGSQSSDQLSDVYESLEELHVLALAHVLKRAIIVIADTFLKDVTGEPFAPIPFGGIYLPLECEAGECHRSPLCLTFDAAHFSALVPMDEDYGEGETKAATIPVTDPDHKLLPMQFAVDPGPDIKWGQDDNDPWVVARLTHTDKQKLLFLNNYLEIKNIELTEENGADSSVQNVPPPYVMNGHLAKAKLYDPYDSDDSSSGISCTGGKSKKNKLKTVARQFGSLGRTMSKKLKHIGNIAKRGGSFKGEMKNLKSKRTLSGLPILSRVTTDSNALNLKQLPVAVLNTEKKHEFQKRLIDNYLNSAINRYESNKINTGKTLECINPGCSNLGSPSASYLCNLCFTKQKNSELAQGYGGSSPAIVVSGNSAFYMEVDRLTKEESIRKMPMASRPLSNGESGKVLREKTHQLNNAPDYKYQTASRGETHHRPSLKSIKESSSM